MSADLPTGWSIRRPDLGDVARILELVHAVDVAAVGEADFSTEEVLEILQAPNHDMERDSWVAFDESGRLAAWAYLDNPTRGDRDLVEVYAHPEFGAPAQRELLDRALVRIAERATEAGFPRVTARAGAIASEKEYIAVLGEAGFTWVKRYARMRRTLTGQETAPDVGDGVTVRTIRAGDDADLRTFFDIISGAFRDIPDSMSGDYDDYRARVAALPSVSWDEWYVAEVDGEPAAVLQSADQTGEQNEGWVKYLAVDRRFRGRGLGRLLLLTAFAAYTAKGRTHAGLGVDMTNPTGAYGLYGSVAMHSLYQSEVYQREVAAA